MIRVEIAGIPSAVYFYGLLKLIDVKLFWILFTPLSNIPNQTSMVYFAAIFKRT